MKRIAAFLLLAALTLACSTPAKAQIFMGPDSTRQAQKASRKSGKKQQKAMKKYQKAQRKAAKRARHRAR